MRTSTSLPTNAGALFASRMETPEGFEQTFALNHLAPFLLTNLLRDRLAGGRVVTTASGAHRSGRLDLDDLQSEKSYSARVYGTSKLCNVLFTRELARRAPELHANCFHPGVVRTGFAKNETGSGRSSPRSARPSSAPRSAAPARWSGSRCPTTPLLSRASTSRTRRWSPPAPRPGTTTSRGASGNKALSSSACPPTRAPDATVRGPLLSSLRASGPRPRSPSFARGKRVSVGS
jgi:NAD(P)-dependent dehydrogenase (short-subunit alcohol dehydrogenase family)